MSGAALGLFSGLRHAFEPDHVVAVSTLVAGRPNAKAATRYAVWWAVGHSAVLGAAGIALYALRAQMSDAWVARAEIVVALMLVGLGVRALWMAWRPSTAAHEHPSAWPFGVGLIHGLAGSGAFVAWLAGTASSWQAATIVVLLYGLGTAIGMSGAALSARGLFSHVHEQALQRAVAASGLLSVVVGIWWFAKAV